MNKFLEEKEKLLNSIENNTPKHWKEYYKNVPLDCIFDDLVLDVNEIKRLTEENKQLKERLQLKDEIINKAKEQLQKGITFCENDSQYAYNICVMAINREKKVLEILDNKGE